WRAGRVCQWRSGVERRRAHGSQTGPGCARPRVEAMKSEIPTSKAPGSRRVKLQRSSKTQAPISALVRLDIRAWSFSEAWSLVLDAFARLVLSLFLTALPALAQPLPTPLIHAHAHNDYEHTRPLFDALDQGFCSVEADI